MRLIRFQSGNFLIGGGLNSFVFSYTFADNSILSKFGSVFLLASNIRSLFLKAMTPAKSYLPINAQSKFQILNNKKKNLLTSGKMYTDDRHICSFLFTFRTLTFYLSFVITTEGEGKSSIFYIYLFYVCECLP